MSYGWWGSWRCPPAFGCINELKIDYYSRQVATSWSCVDGDSVFHTYSVSMPADSRRSAAHTTSLMKTVLDETALGQKEDWEEPKGRATEAPSAISDFS